MLHPAKHSGGSALFTGSPNSVAWFSCVVRNHIDCILIPLLRLCVLVESSGTSNCEVFHPERSYSGIPDDCVSVVHRHTRGAVISTPLEKRATTAVGLRHRAF